MGDGLDGDDHFRNTDARWYGISTEPILRPGKVKETDQVQVLLHMHGEALAAWKQLIDVRFKLLALIPGVSVLALTQLLDIDDSRGIGARWARVAIAVVGLTVIVGLAIYDRRNSELHDDLISRVRRAEAELGVHTGIALGRKTSHRFIQHDRATSLIYGATVVAWLSAVLALLVHATS